MRLATWTLAQASVRGTPSAPERASIVVDGLKLEGATPGNPLFDSRRAELHARVQFGSWPHNPAIDLAVKLAAASAPTIHLITAQPLDADILAVLHGMKDLTPKPMPVRLRDWQAAGGRLEIQSARLAQGESLANATGTLALTQRGGLDGALRLAAAGIERFLPTIGGEGGSSLNLNRVTPALNAIDRAVPGLAQRVTPQRQQTLQTGLLALLGQPTEIEGKRGISGAGPLHRRRRLVRSDPAWARSSRILDTFMHDAVIIGGGHNGLVCAAYLAMAGLKVVVLERRTVVGGAAVTEEFHPGFRNSVAAYTVSLLNPKVIADLGSPRTACGSSSGSIANFLPLDDGRYLKVGGGKTHEEVAKFSARDAERLDAYQARLEAVADVLRALVLETPPNVVRGPSVRGDRRSC